METNLENVELRRLFKCRCEFDGKWAREITKRRSQCDHSTIFVTHIGICLVGHMGKARTAYLLVPSARSNIESVIEGGAENLRTISRSCKKLVKSSVEFLKQVARFEDEGVVIPPMTSFALIVFHHRMIVALSNKDFKAYKEMNDEILEGIMDHSGRETGGIK